MKVIVRGIPEVYCIVLLCIYIINTMLHSTVDLASCHADIPLWPRFAVICDCDPNFFHAVTLYNVIVRVTYATSRNRESRLAKKKEKN